MKLLNILAAAIAATLLPIALAQAQISERTIKFATQNPKDHPITNGMKKFAEIVTAKSLNGKPPYPYSRCVPSIALRGRRPISLRGRAK